LLEYIFSPQTIFTITDTFAELAAETSPQRLIVIPNVAIATIIKVVRLNMDITKKIKHARVAEAISEHA
jgi:hypothetical protein